MVERAQRSIKSTCIHIVRVFILVGLIFGFAPLLSANNAESEYQLARKKYYQLINSSQTGEETEWQICIEMFRKVSDGYPKSKRAADALFTEGLLFWNMHHRFGRVESLYRAIEVYDKLVKVHPKNSLGDDALYNIAIIYKDDLGDKEKATATLDRLISSFPRSEMAKQGRQLLSKLKSGEAKVTRSKGKAKPSKTVEYTEPKVVPKVIAPAPSEVSAASTGPVEVKDIRYWSNPEYTRVSIYLSGKAQFKHNFLKRDPKLKTSNRLYLDLKNSKLTGAVQRKIQIENGILESVRSGQFKKDVARVVLDMTTVYDYQISHRSDPERIVVDVQGKLPDVPKLAKINEPLSEPEKSKPPAAKQPEAKQADNQPKIVYQVPSLKSEKTQNKIDTDLTVDLSRNPKRIIVIDPGHGGDDPGAKGAAGTREKDVVLSIGLKLRDILANDKKYKVIMTRNRDVFIPLPQRSKIANNVRGDLFVSIHADASPRRGASGMSTYVFDNARDEYSRRLEARENASIIRGEKNKPDFLSMMFKSMTKNYFTNQSVELAGMVQSSMFSRLKKRYKNVRSLGVRQARFYVLWNTEMPSILVETSFISNRREERRLASSFYQHEIAQAIAEGLDSYMNRRFTAKID